jgi:excisionase family DNA binding protein
MANKIAAQPTEDREVEGASNVGDWLSTREAAVKLSCSLSQIQKMVEAGDIAAWKTRGGHRRIPVTEINRYLAERGFGRQYVGPASNNRPFRILIAEDSKVMQKLYSKKIEGWNLPTQLSFASDGYTALLMMAKRAPDLIIMDLKMPRMDGYEAIKSIRADRDFDRVDIIVVTGVANISAEKQLHEKVVVYKKPLDFSKLHGFVEASLGRARVT